MNPVGPRLIQPATYAPGTGRPEPGSTTRPPSLGTTAADSSNGRSRIPLPRYPNEVRPTPPCDPVLLLGARDRELDAGRAPLTQHALGRELIGQRYSWARHRR